MKLPHLPPILFAKKIISLTENGAMVLCEFPCIPTLPMVAEAAAQSSAAFCEFEECKSDSAGFLLSLKDVLLLKEPTANSLQILVKKISNFTEVSEFHFEAYESSSAIATGSFTVLIKNG